MPDDDACVVQYEARINTKGQQRRCLRQSESDSQTRPEQEDGEEEVGLEACLAH